MKSILQRMVWLALVGAAVTTTSLAKTGFETKLEGTINDFTADLDGGGPWIVHGPWTLEIQGESGKADFSAALSMVRSDNTTRSAHTHHVGLTNGDVTPIAGGYRITGAATMTSNGPFAAGLLCLTPMFFLISLLAGLRHRGDAAALILGLMFAPISARFIGGGFDLIVAGLIAGSLAFLIGRKRTPA